MSPDPEELLDIVLEAVKICGVRAIISKGWNNFERIDASQEVFFLGDCPHGELIIVSSKRVLTCRLLC